MKSALPPRQIHPLRRRGSGGFTLIEMLVATGLVVLIMSLFAQIYATAIGSITQQRGMGNNDQKARIITRLLQDDLSNLSYRQADSQYCGTAGLVPITPGDEGAALDKVNQSGYFYLSENNPNNPVDDVLQFTTKVRQPTSDNVYIGKVANLAASGAPDDQYDEPFTDISASAPPGYGKSELAEVAYFVRNGTLFRRVLLIREDGGSENDQPSFDGKPIFGPESEILSEPERDNYRNGATPFWKDFDYSATRFFYDPNDSTPPDGRRSHLWFHSRQSLDNSGDAQIGEDLQPLGLPWNRFGHLNNPMSSHHGHPREYLDVNGDIFLGRFTQQETSSGNFSFPGYEDTNSYELLNRSIPLEHNYDELNGVLTTLSDGQRIGEDVVLTNVEAFDVEVWDPYNNTFVQLGNAGSGAFAANAPPIQDPNYGPRSTNRNNVFDTWHPKARYGEDPDPTPRPPMPPPFRPMDLENPVVIDVNDDANQWQPATPYTVGSQIRVDQLKWGTPPTYNNSWVYEVVEVTDVNPGQSGNTTPSFERHPGRRVQDNNLIWECKDKRIGLRAIRITIRYIDQQTRLPRQVTVVQSFTR